MAHERQHIELMRDIEEARRLVEEQELRVLRDGHRDPGALALAARERLERPVSKGCHVRLLQGPVDHAPVLIRRAREEARAVRSAPVVDELAHGEPRRGLRILRQDGEFLGKLTAVLREDRPAVQEHLAAEGRLDAAERL